jgi:hypothetical protein
MADSDLNPVRYLATSIGAGEPDVLRYFILVVSIILDPAAVLLLWPRRAIINCTALFVASWRQCIV